MFYRRLMRNVAGLLSANLLSSVANMLALVLTARALGPTGVGVLALVEAYGRAVDRVVRFEPWQALIRYGIVANDEGRTDDLKQLVKFCMLFDLFGASLAAVVAMLGIVVAARWLGFDEQHLMLAFAFSASLVFNVSSSSTSVLRMYGRFGLIAQLTIVLGLAKLVMTAVAYWFSGSLLSFGVVLVVHQAVNNLVPFAFGLRELRRQGIDGMWQAPLRGTLARNPRLLRFIANTNVSVIARQSTDRFDVLIVGALVGTAEAGLYQLARRIGTAAQHVDRPLRQCIYPDLARLAAAGDYAGLRRTIFVINGAIGAAGIAALIAVAPNIDVLIRLAFGDAFVPAAPILLCQLVAVTLFLNGSVLTPAMLSVGADAAALRITLVAAGLFFPLLFAILHFGGISYATVAHVVYNGVWLFACMMVFLSRTRPSAAASGSPATA